MMMTMNYPNVYSITNIVCNKTIELHYKISVFFQKWFTEQNQKNFETTDRKNGMKHFSNKLK